MILKLWGSWDSLWIMYNVAILVDITDLDLSQSLNSCREALKWHCSRILSTIFKVKCIVDSWTKSGQIGRVPMRMHTNFERMTLIQLYSENTCNMPYVANLPEYCSVFTHTCVLQYQSWFMDTILYCFKLSINILIAPITHTCSSLKRIDYLFAC